MCCSQQLSFVLQDDPTIKNKDTNTPTFATIHLRVNTPRWRGVPIIMKAGKALNEKKAEMRVQFKDAPAADMMFQGSAIPRNELVMRLQPHEAVYLKTNVKSPGFAATPVQSELEVNYDSRFFAHIEGANPDAYTRLILDVLQGKQAAFVRDDELRRAWEIFTPILKKIETENIQPVVYKQGTRGPEESDRFIEERANYLRNKDYVFYEKEQKDSEKSNEINAIKSATTQNSLKFDEADKCDIGLYGLAVMVRGYTSCCFVGKLTDHVLLLRAKTLLSIWPNMASRYALATDQSLKLT